MTARPSQLEFKAFMANNPGLETSVQGTKTLISIMRQAAQQDIALGKLAMNPANLKNWSQVEDNFYRANPIQSPFAVTPKPENIARLKANPGEAKMFDEAFGPRQRGQGSTLMPTNPYLDSAAADAATAPASENPYVDKQQAPSVSTGRALGEGYLDTAGFGFRDEVRALAHASGLNTDVLGGFAAPIGAARLGYEKLTGQPGEATETYDRVLQETRDLQKAAEEQHPTAFLTGQLGGAVAVPGLGAAKGATIGARMANAARAGAITGGLYGVGSGETPTERAIGGVTGTAAGGALGGVASPVADVAGFGVNKALLGGSKIYNWLRAEFNPAFVEQEAGRRVGQAITQDQAARPTTLADLEATAAGHAAGIPRIAADEGGELTRALARSAANQSPEAREALTEATRDRFAGQAQRGAQFIRNLTGGADATTTQEGLEAAARAANKPAYAKAYAEEFGRRMA